MFNRYMVNKSYIKQIDSDKTVYFKQKYKPSINHKPIEYLST